MNFNPDTATTHLAWRPSGNDAAADGDCLLIGSDWGSPSRAAEPLISFVNADEPAAPAKAAQQAEHDAEVIDSSLDSPPYLWGGSSFGEDSTSAPNQTVFS